MKGQRMGILFSPLIFIVYWAALLIDSDMFKTDSVPTIASLTWFPLSLWDNYRAVLYAYKGIAKHCCRLIDLFTINPSIGRLRKALPGYYFAFIFPLSHFFHLLSFFTVIRFLAIFQASGLLGAWITKHLGLRPRTDSLTQKRYWFNILAIIFRL